MSVVITDDEVSKEIFDFIKSKIEVPENVKKFVLTFEVDCFMVAEVSYLPKPIEKNTD